MRRGAFPVTETEPPLPGAQPAAVLPEVPNLDAANPTDPLERAGIQRLPASAYSGKSLLTSALGKGLGYSPETEISADVAADRVRRYLDARKGVREEDPISPMDALTLARQKLDQAKSQLFATVSGGPEVPPFDQGRYDAISNEMFPQPIQRPIANFGDVPEEQRALAIGYALARMLRGESLGQAAGYLMEPVKMAQGRLDQEHAFQTQSAGVNAAQARFDMESFLTQSAEERKRAYDQWGVEVELQGDAVKAGERLVEKLETQAGRAMDNQEKMLLDQVTRGKYVEDRVGALNQLRMRGKLSENEYAAMFAVAATPRVGEEKEDAIKQRQLADAKVKLTRAEFIPKEHQLKVDNLNRLIKRDTESAKIARDRLQIAADANEIRLQIADQRDQTKRFELGLRAPLWSAQVAQAFAAAQANGFRQVEGLWKAYESQIKEQQKEVGSLRDDLKDAIRKVKDLKGDAKDAMEELIDSIRESLAKEERRMIELEAEYESIRPKVSVEGPTGKTKVETPPFNPMKGELPGVGGVRIDLPPPGKDEPPPKRRGGK